MTDLVEGFTATTNDDVTVSLAITPAGMAAIVRDWGHKEGFSAALVEAFVETVATGEVPTDLVPEVQAEADAWAARQEAEASA